MADERAAAMRRGATLRCKAAGIRVARSAARRPLASTLKLPDSFQELRLHVWAMSGRPGITLGLLRGPARCRSLSECLAPNQPRVKAIPVQQLGVRTLLHSMALMHHHDEVGVTNRG